MFVLVLLLFEFDLVDLPYMCIELIVLVYFLILWFVLLLDICELFAGGLLEFGVLVCYQSYLFAVCVQLDGLYCWTSLLLCLFCGICFAASVFVCYFAVFHFV